MEINTMTTENTSTAVSVSPATPAAPAAIVFTVKENDIVTGTVAKIKQHPDKGILVVIAGNPMSFMPNGCVAGKNEAEKAARRAHLIANPGTEISIAVMSPPSVETVKGKQVGRIKVSEQRAVIAAERAQQATKAAERSQAIETAVAALVIGSVVEGTVRGPATKPSDRKDGTTYTYGAFVTVGDGISGLLHVKQIEGGHRALEAILADGKVEVEILDAKVENGQPRVQLSQKSAGQKAFFADYPVGTKVKGKVVKTGEQADSLHGRVIELARGVNVFLCEDDACVKSESSLAKGNSTRVIITGETAGGMVRVTRRGV
jgi:predicted RNA-binding protein with RPS1 domain